MKDPRAARELINQSVTLHTLISDIWGQELPQTLKPQQLSCFFHGKDSSRSARYYPETNSMHCWACKKSWGPIDFWMQHHGVRFYAAVEQLAGRFGVDMAQVPDIQFTKKMNFSGGTNKNIDKKKMALYILEERLKLAKYVESTESFAKMLYVFLNARHIEDDARFAKIVAPLARKLKTILG